MKRKVAIAWLGFVSVSIGLVAIHAARQAMAQATKPSPASDKKSSFARKNTATRQGVVGGGMVAHGMPDDDGLPPFNVLVDPTLTLTPAQLAIYQQLATDISGFATIPNDRLNYYSAINSPPDSTIGGWNGLIQNVQANDCGYVVTVFVTPNLSTTDFGGATVICVSDYCETYQVTNDIVQYLGFTDPNGLGGQSPMEMEGY
jgi:hypothetical protein